MFYWLSDYLKEIFSPANVLRYVTFRAAAAAVTAFLFAVLAGRPIIAWLKHRRVGDNVNREACERISELHKGKQGTPTMGGVMIIAGVAAASLLWGNLSSRLLLLALGSTLWLGAVGFVDDLLKLRRGSAAGLKARHKFLAQVVLGVVIGAILYWWPLDVAKLWTVQVGPEFNYRNYVDTGLSTCLAFPFAKNLLPQIGLGYLLFATLVIVGTSNAVNLADGLDGLAVGSSLLVVGVYTIFAYIAGNWVLSRYLNVLFVEGAAEVSVFCAAVFGAGLGFLWFNASPAEVFMGDTGALALGGALGSVALLVKQELVLVIAGGVFVAEALSVFVQVASFKTTGRRVLLMSPLHHHYELRGWAEQKIVVRFWIVSIIFALIALASLKVR